MSWKPWAAGASLYILFLAGTAPASLLSDRLSAATSGAVGLVDTHGSVWRGEGRLVAAASRGMATEITPLSWRVQPFRLLLGQLQVAFRGPGTQGSRGVARISRSAMVLKDVDVWLPAAVVSAVYGPAALLEPEGRLRLRAEALTLSNTLVEGKGELSWQNAASALSAVRPLGDYRLSMEGLADRVTLDLTTDRGILELRGRGTWTPAQGGTLSFQGQARAVDKNPAVEPLLRLMGPENSTGARAFVLNSRLLLPFRRPA